MSEALRWLFHQQFYGVSLKLETMSRLLEALGNPEKNFSVLHIAGTNGKGSVSAMTESILRAAGYRTGLYTSPHLMEFNERIRVQGVSISQTSLESSLHRLQKVSEGWEQKPTFFELTTALAFDYFASQGCDIVVLETGVGGRLDATNLAINKRACAITPIGLDHQALLGATLPLIAKEKAGIMRPGVPVVSAPQAAEVALVLQEEADKLGAPLNIISEPLPNSFALNLLGSYQRWNAAVALALVSHAGLKISQQAIEEGLIRVAWPGRFQPFLFKNNISDKEERLLLLDGAHNEAGAEQLVRTWKEYFGEERCTLIFGALGDKDWKKMLQALKPIVATTIFVPVASPRTALVDDLLLEESEVAVFSSSCLKKSLCELGWLFPKKNAPALFHHGSAAFFSFLKKRKKNLLTQDRFQAPILVTGSLFLVGEALALLEGKRYRASMQ